MSTKRPRNFDSTKTLQPFSDIEEFLKLSHPDQHVKFNEKENIKIEAKQNISIPKIIPVDQYHLYARFSEKERIDKKIKYQMGYVRILHEQTVPKPRTYELSDKDKKYFDEYVLAKKENQNLKNSDFENLIVFFEETSGKQEIAKIEKMKEHFLNIQNQNNQQNLKNIFSLQQMEELYGYWVSRRQFYKRPLLRSLQAAVPGQDDNNYHLAFRPQPISNEKMKTRKQTDQDNVQKKFQQLVDEFKQHNLLIQCINAREQLKYQFAVDYNEKFTDQIFKTDKNANFKYQGLFECNNSKEYEDKKKDLKKFKIPEALNQSKKTNKEVTEFLKLRGKIPTIQQQQQEKLAQQQLIQEQQKPEPKPEPKPEIKPEPIVIPPIIKPKTPSPKKISPQEEILREQSYIVAQFISSLYMESKKFDIQPRDLEPQNLENIVKKIKDLRPQPKPQPQVNIAQPQKQQPQTTQQARVDDQKQLTQLLKPLKNYKKYIEEKKLALIQPLAQQQVQGQKNFINFHIYKVNGRQNQPYLQRTFEKLQHRDNNFYQIKQKEKSLQDIISTQIHKDNFQPKKDLFKTMHIQKKLKNIIENIRYDTFDEDNNILGYEMEKEPEQEKKENEENFFESVRSNLMNQKLKLEQQKEEEKNTQNNNNINNSVTLDNKQSSVLQKNSANFLNNNNSSYPNSNTNSSNLQNNVSKQSYPLKQGGQGKFPLNSSQNSLHNQPEQFNVLKISSINNNSNNNNNSNQGKQQMETINSQNQNQNIQNAEPYYNQNNQNNLMQIEKENSNFNYKNSQEPIQNNLYDNGDQFYNN